MVKLTKAQVEALKELGRYDSMGARQVRLKRDGFSRSVLIALAGKGLAEWQQTTIGTAWWITPAGRSALVKP